MTDHDVLHEQLGRLSAGMSTDLAGLDRVARQRGTRIRRRRQSLVAVGSAAVVAVTALGVSAVAGGSQDAAPASGGASDGARDVGPSPDVPSATPSDSPSPRRQATGDQATVPLDGRTTAALLDEMVGEVAPDGATTDHAGQGGGGGVHRDTYAELRLTPAGDQGFGVVGVNVQGRDIIEDLGAFGCLGYMRECTSRTLPDGDRLRTYYEPSDGAGDVQLVAERWTADDTVRIIVSADNGLDLGGNEWEITRPTPVLALAQLTEIVTDSRWGFEVPGRYAAAGRDLGPYTDLDSGIDANSPTPTG